MVRRRPEDAVEREHYAPRAAPLYWFGAKASQRGTDTIDICNNSSIDSSKDGGGGGGGSNKTSNDSFQSLPVTFHVYATPNSNFRKRDPGAPDFWVVVCRYADSMPTHAALAALAKRARACANPADLSAAASRTLEKGDRLTRKGDKGTAGKTSKPPRAPNALKHSIAFRPVADVRNGDSEDVANDSMLEEATVEVQGRGDSDFGWGFTRIKLAVVTGEGGVHLFDVGVHDNPMDIK